MNTKRFLLAGCATIILSAGAAQAGSCDTIVQLEMSQRLRRMSKNRCRASLRRRSKLKVSSLQRGRLIKAVE